MDDLAWLIDGRQMARDRIHVYRVKVRIKFYLISIYSSIYCMNTHDC